MATTSVDVKKLLESGAHFGHKTSRWHPKMATYIHSKRQGSHIIDLTKTAVKLAEACDFIENLSSDGKQILLVGTKRQAKDVINETANETKMPFVTERWIGGTLTNSSTINNRIKHLKDLESQMESGTLAAKYNKLELQRFQEEIDEMNILYGGIKDMSSKPSALYVVDILTEANAVREARKLSIPVVAIVDSNADPTLVDYPIPANDDAIKSIKLITQHIKDAIEAGKNKSKSEDKKNGKEGE